MKKSWHLSRRTFLRAAGVSIGLPLLEGMTPVGRLAKADDTKTAPRRMAAFYIPNGVNNSNWIPQNDGFKYDLAPTHEPLHELQDDFSIISGIGHPGVESSHPGGDVFLTGAVLNEAPGLDYKNTISVDQAAANHLSKFTRFPSLELSRAGGTGSLRATHTMSFSREGVPLAAENKPRLVFERLFVEDKGTSRAAVQQRLSDDQSILDIIQDDTRSLNRRLGKRDKQKLDEYLTAVRSVEQQVQRSKAWMDVPKPQVDGKNLNFDVNSRSHDDLQDFMAVMFDLMFLAFQTDTTRVATFQIHPETTGQDFNAFLGFGGNYHGFSHHGGDPKTLEKLAKIDLFHIEQFAIFVKKLKAAEEADGSMLDRTMLVYGGGVNNGYTGGHYNTNIPVLFAGGKGLGIKQGQHLAFKQDGRKAYEDKPTSPPLTNLFNTMLRHLHVPAKPFANSTGTISEFSA
jgi:hypothetical protein